MEQKKILKKSRVMLNKMQTKQKLYETSTKWS